jgi:hypothetical protein
VTLYANCDALVFLSSSNEIKLSLLFIYLSPSFAFIKVLFLLFFPFYEVREIVKLSFGRIAFVIFGLDWTD